MTLFLLALALANPAEGARDADFKSANAIQAADRAAFERWVDNRLATIADEKSPPPARAAAKADLQAAKVDIESFFHAGAPSHDFARTYLYNEFIREPIDRLDPRRAIGRLTGKPPASTGSDVSHTSFFTNVAVESYTVERLAQEFASALPRPPLTITKEKQNGTSEGLWVKDATGRTYILIFDSPFAPEMTTAAEFIGSSLVRLLGYHVPTTCVAVVIGTRDPRFDGRRVVATIALDDFKGGWRYDSFRDRREIRALQLVGGWINNVDQTEQNTGMTVKGSVIRHYVLDFGSSLGSFTFRPQPARLGWTRLFDPYEQLMQPLNDAGVRRVSWEAPYRAHSAAVGYFTANYDPDRWQPFYANMGFRDVTEADRAWAAKRIARVTDEQIRQVVSLAGYSHASDAEHVASVLIARRDIIIRRYLAKDR